MGKDPYAGSAYSDSGMPLGTVTADYDNAEERRKNQVRTRIVRPINLNDNDFVAPVIPESITHRNIKPEDFNEMIDLSKPEKKPEEDISFLDDPEGKKLVEDILERKKEKK